MTLSQRLKKSERDRRYYQRNRDEILERKRIYYVEHRDECLARRRRYHAETGA